MRRIYAGLLLLLGAACSLPASTIPYPNRGKVAPAQSFVATTSGDVIAYFDASTANHTDQIGLFVNGSQVGGWVFDNKSATFGQLIDFGYFEEGTPLVFAINDTTAKTILYSDPTLNSDGDPHTYATAFSGQTSSGVTIPAGVYVGFEDKPAPAADFNYMDEQIAVDNVSLSPEPNPMIAVALGAVCIGVGTFRRVRRRSAQRA